MRSKLVATALACASVLAACATGPAYQRPEMALPAQFKQAPAGWKLAEPADAAPRGAWWQAFGDAQLDALMAQSDGANQNLRAAEARWRQATALARSARAALLPTLAAQASATRSFSGSTSGRASNSVQAGVSADWELDLWGRVRNQVSAQDASTQASLADLANTRLSLQAELAGNYFALRVADAQRALLDATVKAYETSLQLTRNRYAAGVVSRADVAQAETQWLVARTQLADSAVQRAQLEHAIALLLGRAPADFSLPAASALATEPVGQLSVTLPAVPPLLPSQLLERRPDVATAERQTAAANASIGVAQAALFPSLSLSASAGTRGSTLADLFSLPNRFWSLGPALAATLFDGGARRAAIEQAQARYDETVATYRQTVLGALKDVEDQLISLATLESEAELQTQTVRAAGEALALTLNQYRAGTVPYLNVVSAQTTDQSARRSALDITGRQLSAAVALIKALGGGWRASAASPGATGPPPPAQRPEPVI